MVAEDKFFIFSPPSKVNNQHGEATSNRWWCDTFWVYSEFKVMLCCSSQLYPCAFWATTSGLCIETWAYQVEPPVTDVELNSQNCSNSKKWHSTAISCATSAFKHFTVQKCWKLWSSFLLLFKEKINAVITLVRFPSWKHGHEIRLLGFHFDGGMSEWYWEVDV